ncbi:MAG: anti-sigma factor antagonist [Proteobacteria bacterium]|nr:anti-sigma factor antagonist [Pseudomonadota bacterium]NIS71736.1 anti-sigma factor antagonist [Pseudomonadota bacterium]
MDLEVSYLKDHHVHLVTVKGRLDSYYALQLENSLRPLLRKAKKIIMDCSEVTFLSSAGIQILLSLTNLLKRRGGGLVLLNLQEATKKVLRTSKTLDLFYHTHDSKEAVRLLEGE